MSLIHWLLVVTASCLAVATPAAALDPKNEVRISGWHVFTAMTEFHGLSCQAHRCDRQNCQDPKTRVLLKLWGSQNRNAVTPVLDFGRSIPDDSSASANISGISFAFSRSKLKGSVKLVPTNASDDKAFIAAVQEAALADRRAKLIVSSPLGSHKIKLQGLPEVLAYFEQYCSIR
ncbi:hypothetical protein [Leisingera sp. ANG-M1]|uniref:hypothetical protein n=1 Tax=Leisingera sp. ANG-M1 TaxID=1577895 RepID=UPI001269B148|nr:hypothetical protein [Leisingera sp. ANG-M1]